MSTTHPVQHGRPDASAEGHRPSIPNTATAHISQHHNMSRRAADVTNGPYGTAKYCVFASGGAAGPRGITHSAILHHSKDLLQLQSLHHTSEQLSRCHHISLAEHTIA